MVSEINLFSTYRKIDKTLTPSLVKDIVDGINRKGAQLVTQGRLLGFQCWYDPSDNPKENLRDGKANIRYKYTPVPPLENLTLTQEFTDEYFAVFDQLG
ncbi:phage tail sheath C-terminal domain-containing protein [Providencia rettgeri]|nr:phage tail sheath C-terminal domain-containing protein [Providencia rettgeri]MDL9982090.1 phage tail sheath C-terminal domain-containing protein [Providencia rettgeri]MDL9985716.1 phage tail sheath C-terminal domain-containing protein [Providencia rettgeri]